MEKHPLRIIIENNDMKVSLEDKDASERLESYYDLCCQGAMALGYHPDTIADYFK